MSTNSAPLNDDKRNAVADDPAIPALQKRGRRQNAAPDPVYLEALRRFGNRPSNDLIAKGWKQFNGYWETSEAGRKYLAIDGLRVIVFDNRTLVKTEHIHTQECWSINEYYRKPYLRPSFTVGFGHDDDRGLRYLRVGRDSEEAATKLGSAVALAFMEARRVPEPWLWPPTSPDRLRREPVPGDQLERELEDWEAQRLRELAALDIWKAEQRPI